MSAIRRLSNPQLFFTEEEALDFADRQEMRLGCQKCRHSLPFCCVSHIDGWPLLGAQCVHFMALSKEVCDA